MRRYVLLLVFALAAALPPAFVQGQQILGQVSVSIPMGSPCSNTSDMVFATYNNDSHNDGWAWSGGAGGVQGANALHYNTNGSTNAVVAANEVFGFDIGSTVDSLNAQFGAGYWTIANPTLTFTSSYSIQRSSRFAQGAGGFAIYWAANNNWFQSSTVQSDNPVYATSQAGLLPWAGQTALVGSGYFTNSGSGAVNLSYNLSLDPNFVNAILAASAANGSNQSVTLYLMATDSDIGMFIYTGGPGDSHPEPTPTLSFEVVTPSSNSNSVPAISPTGFAIAALALAGVFALIGARRKVFDRAD